MEIESVKNDYLPMKVQEQLKLYIINKGLRSGDALPSEKEMAESLGTSRAVIRESLKVMEGLGIIEVKHGIGRFLREFNFEAILNNLSYSLEGNVKDFKDVLDVRVVLESEYIAKAIESFYEEDVQHVEALLQEIIILVKENAPERKLVLKHAEFHCALYRNLDNGLLINLIKIFSTIQRNLTYINEYYQSDREQFIQQHRDIIHAIKSKDADHAKTCMIDHFKEPLTWVKKHQKITP